MSRISKTMERGALIVVEGMDRTGKSTQCKKLVESLRQRNVKAEYMNFPDRTTPVGKLINDYLSCANDFADEVIHLLFSANRWEARDKILNKLQSGITLVVDRYCYSGVAFSAAKGLDRNWCQNPDVGLPRPDKVFFLTMALSDLQNRNGFGEERYEVMEFQEKVTLNYAVLKDKTWEAILADRSIDEVHDVLLKKTCKVIKQCSHEPIRKVWTEEIY